MCVLDQRCMRGTTGEGHRQQYNGHRENHRRTHYDSGVESFICRSCPWQTGFCTWCSSPSHSVSPTRNWCICYLGGWCFRWFVHDPCHLGLGVLLCPVDVDSMAHVETER